MAVLSQAVLLASAMLVFVAGVTAQDAGLVDAVSSDPAYCSKFKPACIAVCTLLAPGSKVHEKCAAAKHKPAGHFCKLVPLSVRPSAGADNLRWPIATQCKCGSLDANKQAMQAVSGTASPSIPI